MPSRNQRSGMPASSAKVSRRQAQAARVELGAGGLSHQERRRLRSIIRAWDEDARRRRLERRHTVIVVVGAVMAMAVVGVSFGLAPAIAAAGGQGTSGTFVVGYQNCSPRYGCTWVGFTHAWFRAASPCRPPTCCAARCCEMAAEVTDKSRTNDQGRTAVTGGQASDLLLLQ